MSKSASPLPLPVARLLRQVGADLRDARRRRRLPMAVVAERALIARGTLARVERGDRGVSLGTYATVLFVLGLLDRLGAVADAAADRTGLAVADEHVPQRIRRPRAPRAESR